MMNPWRFVSPETALPCNPACAQPLVSRSFHMGLALFALSALAQPFHAVVHWFQSQDGAPARSAARPACNASVCREVFPPGPATGVDAQSTQPSPWSATARGPAVSATTSARSHRSVRLQSAPSGTTRLRTPSRQSSHSPVRVLYPPTRSNAGRMVIAGRMADVCAELERMVACETWHH